MPAGVIHLGPVTAPAANYDNVATINVCSHEVPLPAYWRIVDLLTVGKSVTEVVQLVIQDTGIRTQKVVTDVVESVAENERSIKAHSGTTSSSSMASSSGPSTASKEKQPGVYRAARIEARRELEAAERSLEDAKGREKKLLKTALTLNQLMEKLRAQNANSPERRNRESTIGREMKQVLHMNKGVEAEIRYAKRLIVIHKASLA